MPSPADVGARFKEYLVQTSAAPNTVMMYSHFASHFGKWVEAHPEFSDALIDPAIRDRALQGYWAELNATHSLASVHLAKYALVRMFGWLELPPATITLPAPRYVGVTHTLKYGLGTQMILHSSDGAPFKAKVFCHDGHVRTTEEISISTIADRFTAKVSVRVEGRRYKVSGLVVVETVTGEPAEYLGNPLIVKFEARGMNAHVLGAGLWRRVHLAPHPAGNIRR